MLVLSTVTERAEKHSSNPEAVANPFYAITTNCLVFGRGECLCPFTRTKALVTTGHVNWSSSNEAELVNRKAAVRTRLESCT
jgi:hypothetical protein